MNSKFNTYIMEMLRQRLELEPDDTSQDRLINAYTPNEAFNEVLMWEGIIGYTETIKGWIKDIYHVNLDEVEVRR